ncbi:MAG: DUF4190 domain-containing protein [bacterium]|nr:DUF4190 domain-containing protein [bacterium]
MNDEMKQDTSPNPPPPQQFQGGNPYGPPPIQPDKPSGLAITAMIMGICSIVICCLNLNLILGIVAVILGFVEKSRINNGTASEAGKSYAMTGIICGFIGIATWILMLFAIGGLGILSIIMEEMQ